MEYQPLIYNMLESYAKTTLRRFHMPGHGGTTDDGFLKAVMPYDVTELEETDNLFDPKGVIAEAQKLAAEKIKTPSTIFCCSGATLCLQGAIYAAVKLKPDKRVYCHRKVHKSVINAFVLLDIQPVWFDSLEGDFSDCGVIVFTWTDYYGNIAPFQDIIRIAEKYGAVTVSDNAHGAHLAFYNSGVLHPTRYNIDFCIDSLHKTLPVLTGGACLNILNPGHTELCREGMRLFGSTSPNYLILASVDRAIAKVSSDVLESTLREIEKLKNEFPAFFAQHTNQNLTDPFRIVLKSQNPEQLYNFLYTKGIKCEFYDSNGVVLIPPYSANSEYFKPLAEALRDFDPGVFNPDKCIKYTIPQRKMTLRQATFSPSCFCPASEALGKVSAREYSLYPPGIPLIVPGEVFNRDIIEILSENYQIFQIIK